MNYAGKIRFLTRNSIFRNHATSHTGGRGLPCGDPPYQQRPGRHHRGRVGHSPPLCGGARGGLIFLALNCILDMKTQKPLFTHNFQNIFLMTFENKKILFHCCVLQGITIPFCRCFRTGWWRGTAACSPGTRSSRSTGWT